MDNPENGDRPVSKVPNYVNWGLGIVLSSLILLPAVTEFYKWRAKVHHYNRVEVLDIDTTYNQYAEPRVPKKSYRLSVDEIDYPVDVPPKIWDKDTEKGDLVSIEIVRDFPLWGKEYDCKNIVKLEE